MVVKNYYKLDAKKYLPVIQDWIIKYADQPQYKHHVPKVYLALTVCHAAIALKRTKLTRLVIDTLT